MDESRSNTWLPHAVHWSLVGGLSVSVLLLVFGLLRTFVQSEHAPDRGPHAVVQTRGTTEPSKADGLLDLGLIVLIGTPVLRVVALAVGWFIERQYRFAAVALAVLGLLALSMFLGLH